MIDILITLLLAVPITAFTTLFIVSVGRINRENEIYMEGYNAGRDDALHRVDRGARDE